MADSAWVGILRKGVIMGQCVSRLQADGSVVLVKFLQFGLAYSPP